MGCINVKTSTNNRGINVTFNVNKPITVAVTPFVCNYNVECSCTKGINVTTNITPISNIIVTPHITGISIKCGVVCSLADVMFINIFPQEVQWITTDDVVIYSIESNTDWIIE